MKIFTLCLAMVVCGIAVAQETDAVDQAMAVNEQRSGNNPVKEEVAEFLVTAADGRMMDIREGKRAAHHGTKIVIQEYGNVMINDQQLMLDLIRKMAAARNIELPADISNEKKEGSEDLANTLEHKFDRKFLRMMIIDHKRDLKLFKKAVKCDDEEVSEFAELYIPVIQNHLARARALMEEA